MTGVPGTKPLKLAVVVSHPIQYHACLWRELSSRPEVDLVVLYCSGNGATHESFDRGFDRTILWDVPLLDGYPHKFFINVSPVRRGLLRFVHPGLLVELMFGRYDAVYVHMTNGLTHVLAVLTARILGKRLIVRSINHQIDQRNRLVRAVRREIRRRFYSLVDRCLYIGQLNKTMFASYGIPMSKLSFAPHVVDNEFFSRQQEELSLNKDEIKAEWNIGADQHVILFCGKFVERKQPILLIEAFVEANLGPNWVLLMVGSGPQQKKMGRIVENRSYSNVLLGGFLNQSEIGRAYLISEVLVLPSKRAETWGLVVNEAMNFGCAIIVSDRVGCGPDLVDGSCGMIFDHRKTSDLADKLRLLASDSTTRATFQRNAVRSIATWNAQSFVSELVRSLQRTTNH